MAVFSSKAADKAAEIVEQEGTPHINLRIGVKGGGCSGFLYDFTLDDHINNDDIVIVQKCSDGKNSVKFVIDSISYTYLDKAEIDYKEGINGSFSIRNPLAKSTCGCG